MPADRGRSAVGRFYARRLRADLQVARRTARAGCVDDGGMNESKGQLATVRQVAERLNVPVKWLSDEARAGRVPHIKIGRRRMFSVEAVRTALLSRAAIENHESEVQDAQR